jgi:hypothetical protein
MGIEIESDFLGERSCGKFFNLGGIPVLPWIFTCLLQVPFLGINRPSINLK